MKTKTHLFSYEEFLSAFFPKGEATIKSSSPFDEGKLISQNALGIVRKSISPSIPSFSKKTEPQRK